MVRLTADLILNARSVLNAVAERELDARGYKIPSIENLGVTKDQYDALDLCDNDIAKLENFPKLLRLRTLLLANNRIAILDPAVAPALPGLSTLVLTNNRISKLSDLTALAGLGALTLLSLVGNPVTRRKHYRLYTIHALPQLKVLDFRKVRIAGASERRRATALLWSAWLLCFSVPATPPALFVPALPVPSQPASLRPALRLLPRFGPKSGRRQLSSSPPSRVRSCSRRRRWRRMGEPLYPAKRTRMWLAAQSTPAGRRLRASRRRLPRLRAQRRSTNWKSSCAQG